MKAARFIVWCTGLAGSVIARAADNPAANGAVTGQLATLLIGMLVVLAAIAGTALLLKRFGKAALRPHSAVRVVAAAAVGPRERVVVVEVGTTWLVVGVAPGSVNALHQMPSMPQPAQSAGNTAKPFAFWLKQRLEKTS